MRYVFRFIINKCCIIKLIFLEINIVTSSDFKTNKSKHCKYGEIILILVNTILFENYHCSAFRMRKFNAKFTVIQ